MNSNYITLKSVRLVCTALNMLYLFLLLRWVGKSCIFIQRVQKSSNRIPKSQSVLFAVSEDQSQYSEIKPDAAEQENHRPDSEDILPASGSYFHFDGTDGKPGLISFYNRPYKREEEVSTNNPERNQNNLLWFIGPAVLLASFIFPSLYLRKILSTVFEDSLLTGKEAYFCSDFMFFKSRYLFPHVLKYNYNHSICIELEEQESCPDLEILSPNIYMYTPCWASPSLCCKLHYYWFWVRLSWGFSMESNLVWIHHDESLCG